MAAFKFAANFKENTSYQSKSLDADGLLGNGLQSKSCNFLFFYFISFAGKNERIGFFDVEMIERRLNRGPGGKCPRET